MDVRGEVHRAGRALARARLLPTTLPSRLGAFPVRLRRSIPNSTRIPKRGGTHVGRASGLPVPKSPASARRWLRATAGRGALATGGCQNRQTGDPPPPVPGPTPESHPASKKTGGLAGGDSPLSASPALNHTKSVCNPVNGSVGFPPASDGAKARSDNEPVENRRSIPFYRSSEEFGITPSSGASGG